MKSQIFFFLILQNCSSVKKTNMLNNNSENEEEKYEIYDDSNQFNEHVSPQLINYEEKIKSKKNDFSLPILHKAATNGDIKLLEKLIIEYKMNANQVDSNGNTPLHYSVQSNKLEATRFMINECNADINIKNYNHIKPLDCTELFSPMYYLIKYPNKKKSELPNEELISSIKKNDLNKVLTILSSKDANPYIRDSYGDSLFHLAINNYAILDILILYIEMNNLNSYIIEKPIIDSLILYNKKEKFYENISINTINIISSYSGMCINILNNRKQTPLDLAKENTAIYQLIKDKGGRHIKKEIIEKISLTYTFKHYFQYIWIKNDILEFDPESKFIEEVLLFNSIKKGNVNLLKLIFNYPGININRWIFDTNVWWNGIYSENIQTTPLNYSILNKQFKVAKLLINNPNININKLDEKGFSPLHIAVIFNQKEILKLLIEKEANLDIKTVNSEGLETCLYNGLFSPLAMVLKGIDILFNYGRNNTPLHLAVIYNNKEMTQMLVHAGADLNKTNSKSKKAIDYAKKNSEIYSLLKTVF